jgi:hypothetical protein
MKVKHLIPAAFLVLAVVAGLTGCDLFGISIAERISDFQADLNKSDRSSVYLNLHSTLTQDYNAAKAATFWNTNFPYIAGTSYSITNVVSSNPANVTATITGPSPYTGGAAISFKMVQEGFNWMIQEIYLFGSGTATVKVLVGQRK